jgi:hypothetical protein
MPYGYPEHQFACGGDPSQIWQICATADGRDHYYNAQLGVSTWSWTSQPAVQEEEGSVFLVFL